MNSVWATVKEWAVVAIFVVSCFAFLAAFFLFWATLAGWCLAAFRWASGL